MTDKLLASIAMQKSMTVLKFCKTHPDAKLPVARPGDVGLDLCSLDQVLIEPLCTERIPTGLLIADTPRVTTSSFSVYMKIESRSGMACDGVFVLGGIIDPGYRGPLDVILHNSDPKHHVLIDPGQRIAQLVIYPVMMQSDDSDIKVFEVPPEHVTPSSRGAAGFGSTGK